MDSRQLATMVRRFGDTRTRRGTLLGGLLALSVPMLPLRGMEAQAKKSKKKKCRPKPIPELSCQEACPESCGSCIRRKVDSILCSNGFTVGLTSCSSDSDCVGVKIGDTAFPYCVTRVEARPTGNIDDIGDGNGICANLNACVAI